MKVSQPQSSGDTRHEAPLVQDRSTGRFERAMKTGAHNSPEAPAFARDETQKAHVL